MPTYTCTAPAGLLDAARKAAWTDALPAGELARMQSIRDRLRE
jgi:hypothetical protein